MIKKVPKIRKRYYINWLWKNRRKLNRDEQEKYISYLCISSCFTRLIQHKYSQTVKADTVEQPATDQRNTQTTTANNQNSKSDQDQSQNNQNTDVAADQTQNQTNQNNTVTDNTNNPDNQNNTGATATDTTNANQDTQNQVGGFTDTTQSTNDYASNSVSDTSYVQNNDAVVFIT